MAPLVYTHFLESAHRGNVNTKSMNYLSTCFLPSLCSSHQVIVDVELARPYAVPTEVLSSTPAGDHWVLHAVGLCRRLQLSPPIPLAADSSRHHTSPPHSSLLIRLPPPLNLAALEPDE